ncbi:hypothetical protein PLICRDRAFT_58318 [Plicaturopsis crispa FD-325 SS-3]|uniref:Unplaced genomic scaffold PLICRscaffold_22, whole genome shotgun sequence n=1 Tax=Plicaturopsis crispa FD-325 SS-3 TaxID=944288 RepID=A0A0C9T2Y0_PLICR|nr:hypothetical protein PLICRDRAFT_58318 [Plicaturopsis crispa FD-325 SS-3]
MSTPQQRKTSQTKSQNAEYDSDPIWDSQRVPRRTPMACQFCRARKMRCDGLRPSCGNCTRRTLACNYVPV